MCCGARKTGGDSSGAPLTASSRSLLLPAALSHFANRYSKCRQYNCLKRQDKKAQTDDQENAISAAAELGGRTGNWPTDSHQPLPFHGPTQQQGPPRHSEARPLPHPTHPPPTSPWRPPLWKAHLPPDRAYPLVQRGSHSKVCGNKAAHHAKQRKGRRDVGDDDINANQKHSPLISMPVSEPVVSSYLSASTPI